MHRHCATLAALAVAVVIAAPAAAAITDLTTWTLIEDPPATFLASDAPTSSAVTLRALDGPVPVGADIGYASANGADTSLSTAGYAFDPASDFAVSIGYDLSFGPAPNVGDLAIGFGIGEDPPGVNSAGAFLTTLSGSALTFGYGARVADQDVGLGAFAAAASIAGRFYASYDAATGDVTVGLGDAVSTSPAITHTFTAIQDDWNDRKLLASFFLRSQPVPIIGSAWTAGSAAAVFSGFSVDDGEPVVIPEPVTAAVLSLGALALVRRRV